MLWRTKNQVKALLLEGLCNKEICARLNISKSGLGYHMRNLYVDYGLSTRSDVRKLVVLLVRESLGVKSAVNGTGQ